MVMLPIQALAEKGKERHKKEVRELVFFGCCIGLGS
jgi:hypothetical protein